MVSHDCRVYLWCHFRRENWPGYSTYTCWQTLLASTKRVSKDHAIAGELYNGQMCNRLADLIDDLQRMYRNVRHRHHHHHHNVCYGSYTSHIFILAVQGHWLCHPRGAHQSAQWAAEREWFICALHPVPSLCIALMFPLSSRPWRRTTCTMGRANKQRANCVMQRTKKQRWNSMPQKELSAKSSETLRSRQKRYDIQMVMHIHIIGSTQCPLSVRDWQRQAKYSENKLKALKSRNEYLLCLDAANAAVHKYFVEDVPDLIDVSW